MNPRWLVRLYPRAWRERYGDELLALIDDTCPGRAGWRLATDLMRGCLGAWGAAAFAWMSPKTRRWLVASTSQLAAWVLGMVVTGGLAIYLPDAGRTARAWTTTGAILASVVVLMWLVTWLAHERPNVARGLPALRPMEILLLAIVALVLGTLGRAQSMQALLAGHDTVWLYLLKGAGPCVLFQPVGLNIAARLWPRVFAGAADDVPRFPLGLSR